MIAASDPQEFVPSGRQQVKRHPGEVVLPSIQPQFQAESLLHRFSQVAISESSPKEWWKLKASPSGEEDCEDELYVSGKTTVWSRGAAADSLCEGNHGRTVLSCHTTESPVHHALWSTFCSYREEDQESSSTVFNVNPVPNLCIVDSSNINIYTQEGEDFISSLPFQVQNVWSMKYGLLLERALSPRMCDGASSLPTLFCLLSPLHEISPVLVKHNDISYMTNPCQKIVFTNEEDPCICMVYNSKTGVHSVWKIRKALLEECQLMCRISNETYVRNKSSFFEHSSFLELSSKAQLTGPLLVQDKGSFSMPGDMSAHHSISFASATSGPAQAHTSPNASQAADEHSSAPFGNRSSASLLHLQQRIGPCRSHPTSPQLHRSFSPLNIVGHQQASTPLMGSVLGRSSRLGFPFHSTLTHATSPLSVTSQGGTSAIGNLSAPIMPPSDSRLLSLPPPDSFSNDVDSRPLIPELCLEHVWSENHGMSREGAQCATKAFLSTDLVGQHYLCFLIEATSIIHCVRMLESNSANLVFGSTTILVAKDACFLPKLSMMAVVDLSGGVVLYSGVAMVGKVQVGGVPSSLSNATYLNSLNLGNQFAASPFIRRQSLLSSSHQESSLDAHFDEDSLVLSPVRGTPTAPFPKPFGLKALFMKSSPKPKFALTPADEMMDEGKQDFCKLGSDGIVKLRDPVGSRVTLEYTNGPLFRITLPELSSSSLVTDCLNTLKQVLQRDIAMQVIIKWYGMRNAPGSKDISPRVEWELFIGVLLGLIGYNVEKLTFLKGQDSEFFSPETLPKKQKTSDEGSNEDWEFLVNDCRERGLEPWLNYLGFDLPPVETAAKDPVDVKEVTARINSSGVLFPYTPMILFSLHLLYEELKLTTLRWESLPMLAQLLHQLAVDLQQPNYIDQYWRDFPKHCRMNKSEGGQLTVDDLMKLNNPGLIPIEPPDVFHHLCLIYKKQKVPPFPYIKQVNEKTKDIIKLAALLCHGSETANVEDFVAPVVASGALEQNTSTSESSLQESQLPYQYRAVLFMAERGFTEENIVLLPSGVALPLHEAMLQCRRDPPLNWPSAAYKLIMRKDLAMLFKPSGAVSSKQSSQFASRMSAPDSDSKSGSSVIGTGVTVVGSSSPGSGVGASGAQGPESRKVSHASDGVEDGMEGMTTEVLLRLRFSKDHRVAEVRRLLQSSQPVSISILQRPGVSDHEFIEDQERHLYTLCTRTMALPVGRGMFTLRTASPVVTEPLPIPRLCLTGKAPPRGATIDLSHIETAPNMNLWPLFHNGVAAGLRIVPEASGIESAWIVYNKPRGNNDIEHAGFLMALGLNGHLSNLAVLNTYEYLSKVHEMTSVGVLLGIAAIKRGTMDMATTKMLSVHVEALLPPTSIELDLPQNVQVAALIGIGLVYQGKAHRHIAEVLLSEIGRPPGPEMDNCFDRESFSLAAGLALGHVVLGLGSSESDDNKRLLSGGLADLHIPDTLHYYMVGGHRRPLTGAQKEKYKTPSYQIREGDSVNIDVTSPGATLALGMMYFNSGNRAVADWMKAPDTQYLLDFVRPDFLILRTVARGLILWNEVYPTSNWVEAQIPDSIRPYCLRKPSPTEEAEIDYETMNQVYCNIMAGACMAIGLRFAGSANDEAFHTLLFYAKMFTSLTIKSISELVGKSTIETCLNVIVLSLAMVMAGTGNLEVMRVCRHLRGRVGISSPSSTAAGATGDTATAAGTAAAGTTAVGTGAAGAGGAAAGGTGASGGGSNSVVTYGSHLATHMALGLLFLGGGRYTLSTSPPAIAALLCAFFPKFPTHSNDNRYHLQALRHLYVLAVEPRLLLPRDIDSGRLCYAHLTLVFLDSSPFREQTITNVKAPCLLPELDLLKEVRVEDDRYWSIIFHRERNWGQLKSMLQNMQGLYVQQKAGCLSYTEDPHGFQSLLAQTLTSNMSNCWSIPPESIFAFTSDPSIITFVQYFMRQGNQFFFKGQKAGGGYGNQSAMTFNEAREEEEMKLMQFMASIVYEQVTLDKPFFLQLWIMFFMALQSLKSNGNAMLTWQLKLLFAHGLSKKNDKDDVPIVSRELTLTVRNKVDKIFDDCEKDMVQLSRKYYMGDLSEKEGFVERLAQYLNLYDLPNPSALSQVHSGPADVISLCKVLEGRHIPAASCFKLMNILSAL
ncbi:anaphase-promoting complex subunit 1 [Hetaerina americana]|uniref:anaphase-promoting complex subunit 1 n=1 Tax=Hetaerina americana TaxID=62018 RepID=UPI003A7F4C56